MSDDKKSPQPPKAEVPQQIQLGASATLDISWLSEDERKALLLEHAQGMLALGRKATELNIDVAALKSSLDEMTIAGKNMGNTGLNFRASHCQSSSIGRTEVTLSKPADSEADRGGRVSRALSELLKR